MRRWILLLVCLSAGIVLVRHLQTYDLTLYTVYFERDAYRASQWLHGEIIWYGPELWGGGNTPGPFLYILNVPPLMVRDHPMSIVIYTYALFSISLVVMYCVFSKTYGPAASAIAVLLVGFNNYLFLDMKVGWNPTESFLPFAIWLWMVLRFTVHRGRVIWFCLAAALTGLLAQIHASYVFHTITLFGLAFLLRRDIRWKGFLSGYVCLVLPVIPYLVYVTCSGDPFVEDVMDRAYRDNLTYFESFEPLRSFHTLSILFWEQPGNLNPHSMSFFSALEPMPAAGAAQAVLAAARATVLLSVAVALSFQLAGVAGVLRGTPIRRWISAVADGRALATRHVVLLALLAVPILFFHSFLGTDIVRPFHYYYILLFPGSLLIGLCVARTARILWSQGRSYVWRGVGRTLGTIQVGVLAAGLIATAIGILAPQRPKLQRYGTALIFYHDAVQLCREIIDRTGLPPDSFGEKVFVQHNLPVISFPHLYEREYALRDSAPPPYDDAIRRLGGGIYITRASGSLEDLASRESRPLRIHWSESIQGYVPFFLYAYHLEPVDEFAHSNMHNGSNPYILTPSDRELLARTHENAWIADGARLPDGRGVRYEVLIELETVNLPIRFRIDLEAESEQRHVVNARIESPYLTGFSAESGMSMMLVEPRLVMIGADGRSLLCPLYARTSNPQHQYSLGEGGFGYFNTPFEVRMQHEPIGPIREIWFEAYCAINTRTHKRINSIRTPLVVPDTPISGELPP